MRELKGIEGSRLCASHQRANSAGAIPCFDVVGADNCWGWHNHWGCVAGRQNHAYNLASLEDADAGVNRLKTSFL
jgi:hypothetical protein